MTRRAHRNGEPVLRVDEILILGMAANQPDGLWGYQLKEVFDIDDNQNMGTIYRRLGRLAEFGYLTASLEGEEAASTHRGPARRLYHVTEAGAQQVSDHAEKLQNILTAMGVEIEQVSTLDP